MSDATEPAEIDIEIGTYGLKKLVVNDFDITDHVDAIKIASSRSNVPVISVALHPGPVKIAGPGIVEIAMESNGKEAVLKFLKALDPHGVERAALDNMGWDKGTGEAFMDKLIELAEDML